MPLLYALLGDQLEVKPSSGDTHDVDFSEDDCLSPDRQRMAHHFLPPFLNSARKTGKF